MNDYDKAGRYLVKRDPIGFCQWLVGNPRLGFHAWIDARRVALPKQNDLTNDLVAVVGGGGIREAMCIELEAEARADTLPRLLAFIWPGSGPNRAVPAACRSLASAERYSILPAVAVPSR